MTSQPVPSGWDSGLRQAKVSEFSTKAAVALQTNNALKGLQPPSVTATTTSKQNRHNGHMQQVDKTPALVTGPIPSRKGRISRFGKKAADDRLPRAPWGSRVALNCRAHSKSPSLTGRKKKRGDVALDEAGPEGRDLSVKVSSLLFRHKAHAEGVLTCCTHIHGE